MSSLNPAYITYIYQHRHPLTWEWLNDLLYQLWLRGIRFSQSLHPNASWEEELQITAFAVQGSNAATLGEALRESLASGSLYLTLWDEDLAYDLELDPNGDTERKELESYQDDPDVDWLAELEDDRKKREAVGNIVLYCDASRKDSLYEEKLAQVKEMPYLRAYRGHLHWSMVLCEILNPLFALGDIRSELPVLPVEEHLLVWELLARGELPDVAFCLQKKAVCYLPAKECTAERLTQLLALPGCSFQRLVNGGGFFSVAHAPFYYENNTAQLQILRGKDPLNLEEAEQRPLTEEVIKERAEYFQMALEHEDLNALKRYFQRALTIYSTMKDRSGVGDAKRLLLWIEETIQEKQQRNK